MLLRSIARRATAFTAVLLAACGGSDTPAPPPMPSSVAFTTPAASADLPDGPLQIAASVADDSAVSRVEFQVDGVTVGSDLTPPYSVNIDTAPYASGQHVLRVRTVDNVGRPSPTWVTRTVRFGGSRVVPAGFARNETFVTGLSAATALAQLPDGRLLVAQQGGALQLRQSSGALISTPLTLTVDSTGERGLLGVAVHPGFPATPVIYVYHTVPGSPPHNRISRFTLSGGTATGVSPLVELPPLSATNHNGGALHFGADGNKLYVAVGDNAVRTRAPDLSTVFGKMLRFNDDGSIPSDNPFCTTPGNLVCAIWARGLRNPFTFAVQPATGRIHINDVGENTWEEINLGTAGADYGWPSTEGPTNAAGITGPLFAFDHDDTPDNTAGFFSGCSIIGGAFYAGGGAFPQGYYFTDFCSKVVGRLDLDPANGNAAYAFGSVSGSPVNMMVANDGALLVLTRSGIERFAPAP